MYLGSQALWNTLFDQVTIGRGPNGRHPMPVLGEVELPHVL